jgi:NADP-dependent 3-hydroxy acid dehydrogenase YdfG
VAKTVVITGASSGIGEACAEAFARGGYRIALGARRLERLTDVAGRLRSVGAPEVLPLALDVTDQDSVDQFTGKIRSAFTDINILINNAGLASGLDPVTTGKDSDWQAMIDTNVYGLLRVTRSFLPALIASGSGHIINMGSIAAFQTYANGAVYAGTKHAVKAITGALKLELNGQPVRVSSIDPGMVETEFSLVRLKDEAKARDVYKGMTPLSAADIADCVYFAATRPPHVNIDHIIVMPTDQATVYKVHRNP